MYITLTELKYVVALFEEKHFARAANKCFVSQPTLSIAIKKLEENLGITIFERSKTNVIVTKIGETIIAKAKLMLELAHEIENIAKMNQDPFIEPLRIGAIHTVGPYLFPSLLRLVQQKLPQLKLHIEEDFTHNLEKKLRDNKLDAIIVAKPFSSNGISTIDLYAEDLVVISNLNHPLAQKKSINPKALANESLLLLGQGHCFRDNVLEICASCNINSQAENNHTIITSSLETIKQMVIYNQGISIVPRSAMLGENSEKLVTINFASKIPHRNIILAYRNNFSRLEVLSQLSNLLQEFGALINQ